MPTYRVRDGNTFGHRPGQQAHAGDMVALTEHEAEPLLGNVLEGPVVEEPEEPTAPAVDLSPYPNIAAVLAAVRGGELDAAAALEAERDGQGRVTLLRELEAHLDGAD